MGNLYSGNYSSVNQSSANNIANTTTQSVEVSAAQSGSSFASSKQQMHVNVTAPKICNWTGDPNDLGGPCAAQTAGQIVMNPVCCKSGTTTTKGDTCPNNQFACDFCGECAPQNVPQPTAPPKPKSTHAKNTIWSGTPGSPFKIYKGPPTSGPSTKNNSKTIYPDLKFSNIICENDTERAQALKATGGTPLMNQTMNPNCNPGPATPKVCCQKYNPGTQSGQSAGKPSEPPANYYDGCPSQDYQGKACPKYWENNDVNESYYNTDIYNQVSASSSRSDLMSNNMLSDDSGCAGISCCGQGSACQNPVLCKGLGGCQSQLTNEQAEINQDGCQKLLEIDADVLKTAFENNSCYAMNGCDMTLSQTSTVDATSQGTLTQNVQANFSATNQNKISNELSSLISQLAAGGGLPFGGSVVSVNVSDTDQSVMNNVSNAVSQSNQQSLNQAQSAVALSDQGLTLNVEGCYDSKIDVTQNSKVSAAVKQLATQVSNNVFKSLNDTSIANNLASSVSQKPAVSWWYIAMLITTCIITVIIILGPMFTTLAEAEETPVQMVYKDMSLYFGLLFLFTALLGFVVYIYAANKKSANTNRDLITENYNKIKEERAECKDCGGANGTPEQWNNYLQSTAWCPVEDVGNTYGAVCTLPDSWDVPEDEFPKNNSTKVPLTEGSVVTVQYNGKQYDNVLITDTADTMYANLSAYVNFIEGKYQQYIQSIEHSGELNKAAKAVEDAVSKLGEMYEAGIQTSPDQSIINMVPELLLTELMILPPLGPPSTNQSSIGNQLYIVNQWKACFRDNIICGQVFNNEQGGGMQLCIGKQYKDGNLYGEVEQTFLLYGNMPLGFKTAGYDDQWAEKLADLGVVNTTPMMMRGCAFIATCSSNLPAMAFTQCVPATPCKLTTFGQSSDCGDYAPQWPPPIPYKITALSVLREILGYFVSDVADILPVTVGGGFLASVGASDTDPSGVGGEALDINKVVISRKNAGPQASSKKFASYQKQVTLGKQIGFCKGNMDTANTWCRWMLAFIIIFSIGTVIFIALIIWGAKASNSIIRNSVTIKPKSVASKARVSVAGAGGSKLGGRAIARK